MLDQTSIDLAGVTRNANYDSSAKQNTFILDRDVIQSYI